MNGKTPIALIAFLVFVTTSLFGQTNTVEAAGGAAPCINKVIRYNSITTGGSYTPNRWSWTIGTGGTISSGGGSTDSYVEVTWSGLTMSVRVQPLYNSGGSDMPVGTTAELAGPTTPGNPLITDIHRCGTGTVVLTATKGTDATHLRWYDASNTYLGQSDTYTTSSLSSTTGFKVSSYTSSNTCESNKVDINAVIDPFPDPPTGSTTVSPCASGGQATLTASPGTNGNQVVWDDLTGVSAPGTTATSEVIYANTTYHIRSYNSTTGCYSTSATTVVATVNPLPSVPTSLVHGSRYGAGTVSLSASVSSGTTAKWYSATTGGSPFDSGASITSPSVSVSTPYFVSARNNSTSCESARVRVNVTIKALNSVATYTILSPDVTDESTVSSLSITDAMMSSTYLDGLGRPIQTVAKKGSPSQVDIVTPVTYDVAGREKRKYLPFANGTNGQFKSTEAIIDSNGDYTGSAQTFYSASGDKIANDTKPFSEIVYEKSPLNRVQKSGAPGSAWQPVDTDPLSTNDKTIKKRYELNDTSEVHLFVYDPDTGLASTASYYDAGQLVATRTLDEKNNDVIEYVDKYGHMVCKKVRVDSTKYASTYYVYDELDNLVVVLPPEAIKSILSSY